MTSLIGYLKTDDNLAANTSQLRAAGASEIVAETSAEVENVAPSLQRLLANLGRGDTLVVPALHHLAHSTRQLQQRVAALDAAGARLRVLDCGLETTPPLGAVVRQWLDALADFERQVVRERQAAGIAKAKQEGRYRGRKPTARAKSAEVLALAAQGLTRQAIADQLEIGVASVYRILKKQAAPPNVRKKPQPKPVDKPKQRVRKPPQEGAGEQLSFF